MQPLSSSVLIVTIINAFFYLLTSGLIGSSSQCVCAICPAATRSSLFGSSASLKSLTNLSKCLINPSSTSLAWPIKVNWISTCVMLSPTCHLVLDIFSLVIDTVLLILQPPRFYVLVPFVAIHMIGVRAHTSGMHRTCIDSYFHIFQLKYLTI